MRFISFVVLCSSLLLVAVAFIRPTKADDENITDLAEYLDKYKHIDVDEVLNNDRLFNSYYNCFTEGGACTAEAKAIKKAIPVIKETQCAQCTPDQKKTLRKILRHIKENKADHWKNIMDKYQPDENKVNQFLNEAD